MKKYNHLPPDSVVAEPALSYKISPVYNNVWSHTSLTVVHDARKGFTFGDLLVLAKILDLSLSDLTLIFNVSLRTLQRYDQSQKLDADASSKLIQLSMLKARGLEVFGDQSAFNIWLKKPMMELDDSTPLSMLDTPFGYQILFQVLGRIEHGIFA
jgi:putative toxin-antitoxin system antitoxin component (TIGR02293 family)